ncbi:hypothetical protein [Acetobacterium sp.]|uniref:hypothetical protein n=1 Tax=Acetobacterium sp. TaxID=1872094 RepID=UPI00271A70D5|nr:hypothetical protein [Acetobacterium sp.]MDO9490964.1 hypothetical protein [Acetobacterium sp.]
MARSPGSRLILSRPTGSVWRPSGTIADEPFAEIARAMGYDLRWVYRLHARGLGTADEGEKRKP